MVPKISTDRGTPVAGFLVFYSGTTVLAEGGVCGARLLPAKMALRKPVRRARGKDGLPQRSWSLARIEALAAGFLVFFSARRRYCRCSSGSRHDGAGWL